LGWEAQGEPKWTQGQKAAARKAFEAALERECRAIRAKVVQMLEKEPDPLEIFRIHDYLGEQRREVNRKYDYRYSVLISVFATLLREGWLKEEELSGNGDEKVRRVKELATLE
jgi:Photoprotection regulator fluorescence recovery protein